MKPVPPKSPAFIPAHSFTATDITITYGLQSPFTHHIAAENNCQLIVMPDTACEAEFYWHAPEGVGKNIWLSGPRVIYVPQNTPGSLVWLREAALVCFVFAGGFLKRSNTPFPQERVIIKHEWEMAGADLIVHQLFLIFSKLCRHTGKTSECARYLEALGVFAARHIVAQLTKKPKEEVANGLSLTRLRNVQEYIEKNLSEQISSEELARIAGFGQHHFTRLFKASTGMPPRRYILMKRLEYAQRLLAEGNLRIAEIAAEAGFFDQSHLGQSLKRFCGHSDGSERNADFILKKAAPLQVTAE